MTICNNRSNPSFLRVYSAFVMEAKGLTLLNASDIVGTFAWFEKWGWKKLWDWGTPQTFGAVGSGLLVRKTHSEMPGPPGSS